MKAISPMVAVVLLIAFTVGVGGLVSIFVTGLTTTSTGITGNQSEALTRCAGGWINVYSVDSDQVHYANPTSQTLTSLVIVFSNGSVAAGTSQGDPSLTPGEYNSTNITTRGSNTFVIVRGLCQALVSVEGKCQTGQDCWDA